MDDPAVQQSPASPVAPEARRLLMISYNFPPLGGIASVRAAKLSQYLPEFGWVPTVISPEEGNYYRDGSLDFHDDRVVRTRSIEISRMAKKALGKGSDTQPANVGVVLGRVRHAARVFVYFPDGEVGWYPFAVRAGNRLCGTTQFDAILSSSTPVTSHVVARSLSRRHGVPWIAEFRDPWWENPGDTGASSRVWRQRAQRLEKSFLQHADTIVVTSPSWAELFRQKGARQVGVVTNGFDPRDLPPRQAPSETVLTHVGSRSYFGHQDLSPIWAAIQRLRRTGAPPVDKILFVGNPDPTLRQQLAEYGLDDIAEITGFLPHEEALRRLMSSSALLVAGASNDVPILRGVIPGKIFEYLGSGLPIIYVGRHDVDPARLLSTFPGCTLVAPGDIDAAEKALEAVRGECVARDASAITWRALASRLAELLDRAAERSRRR